ncbi:MAG: MBL fold metallo-hydrolase [Candidatus Latescibacterota bacterium]|nr:MBL fold metallo-hydrolase [Candidatus Latescibacterota bacterium]
MIDCGQLGPKEVSDQIGLDVGERLLLTHFHRDQCGAASTWVECGGSVSIPFSERRFFEEGDILRASYDIYDNYTAYFPTFSSLDDVRSEPITDYDSVSWRGLSFQAIPLPGHTFGSTGYLFELDGERVLAVGDVMAAPGKLHEYYSSQWTYMSFQGHVNLLESLDAIQRLEVDWILPGHGVPFEATDDAFTELSSRLVELYELYYAKPYRPFRPEFKQLSQHVYEVNSAAHTYIVKDDEGHGLLIDCGYVSNARIGANPHRFIDRLTPWLEENTEVTDVEWFLPSHYHDDHLAGLPTLQIKYGTRIASSPEVKDIIEHPERYEMPCLVPHGTKVDRVIERDEVFQWRGIDFRMEQFPGQTWYHHLITFEVDGKRYLSIGDNISGMCFREKRDFIHSFIPKNRTQVSTYSDMPRQIVERNPDVILTGHGGGVDADPYKIAKWQVWMDRWTELFTDIIDQPHPNLGMDPHWVEFYPFKIRANPGDEVKFEVRVRNHEDEARTGSILFRGPDGVSLSPKSIEIEMRAEQDATFQLIATMPLETRVHSWTVAADVTWNGKHLGEISEGIVYW